MANFIKCTRLNGRPVLVNLDLVATVEKDWEGATLTIPGADDIRLKDAQCMVIEKIAYTMRKQTREDGGRRAKRDDLNNNSSKKDRPQTEIT